MRLTTPAVLSIAAAAGLVCGPASIVTPEAAPVPPDDPAELVVDASDLGSGGDSPNEGAGGGQQGTGESGSGDAGSGGVGCLITAAPLFRGPDGSRVDSPGPESLQYFGASCTRGFSCPAGFDTIQTWPASSEADVAVECAAWLPPGSAPAITVDDLVPGVIDQATRRIPQPSLDMSPPPEFGGLVNFGLWLAIQPADPVTARAEAGDVWAAATATLESTRWDMGNGDIVDCAGFGDPIIDLDTDEPSPVCGYTYGWPSAPQFTGTGDLAYHASVVAHWSVQVTGSDGRNEPAGVRSLELEFTYQVREVQTVGAAD